ncbi:hypothetical protein [Azospirillum sp. INR13]
MDVDFEHDRREIVIQWNLRDLRPSPAPP